MFEYLTMKGHREILSWYLDGVFLLFTLNIEVGERGDPHSRCVVVSIPSTEQRLGCTAA